MSDDFNKLMEYLEETPVPDDTLLEVLVRQLCYSLRDKRDDLPACVKQVKAFEKLIGKEAFDIIRNKVALHILFAWKDYEAENAR